MNTSRLTIAALTAVSMLAAGCATTSTSSNAAKTKTMTVEQISQQWKQGNDLVAKGEDAKRKAQVKIDAANQEMKEADSMMSRGKTLMQESEQAFRDTSRRTANN